MDLRDYVRTLRKRWTLVLLCTLLAIGAAAVATLATTKLYTSSTQLFVSARDQSGSISDAVQGGVFTQQRVKSYAQVADSPAVTDKVASRLNLPASEFTKVSADTPLDTVLLNITVTSRTPELAQRIAAAVSDEVVRLIPTLETTAGSSKAPVKLTVIKKASLPTGPSSPRPKINLALGLLVGLAIGVGVAVLRETLDTTIKGKDDLQELTGATPLGIIANDPTVEHRPLVVHGQAQSPRSEAFRQLRTNLQFVDVDRPPKSVVVTSPLAGEGKSTTSCNLAITMAQTGLRTILVEADLRRPRVADYMGLEGAVGLTSVLTGVAALDDALQPWGRNAMWVLASGPLPPNPSEILGSHQMVELLKSLGERADVVVIDSPPLLPVTDAAVLARIVDGAVLVVRHGNTRREQVTRAIEALQRVDARLLGTVLNRSPVKGPDSDRYGYGPGYYNTRDSQDPRVGADPRANDSAAADVAPKNRFRKSGRARAR